MTHPTTRIVLSLAVLGGLSACASKPQLSAQQESTQYLSRAAGRNYTPPGPSSDPWGPYVKEAAGKFDVPERWIREVMRQESGGRLYGRNGDLVTSSAGAMGLMQVMPGTYAELRARYSELLGDDAFDPRNNILAGTAYIREMYDIYGSPGFLAAYNAGPGRLDDHLTRNRTLPEETRRYVASIGPKIAGVSPNTRSPGEQFAMNSLPMQIPDGPRYPAARFRSPEPSRAVAIALNPAPYAPAAAPYVPEPSIPEPQRQPIRLAQAQPLADLPLADQSLAEPPRIRLAPQPDLAEPYIPTPPQPVQLAQLQPLPEPPRVRQAPQPVFEPAPEPRRAAAQQFAALTPVFPPMPPPLPPRAQAAAALVPASPPQPRFSLVSTANAAPVRGAPPGAVPGGWAVQVGAFANPSLAGAATAAAQGQAREALNGARPQVASVRQGSGTLYRARFTGLSRTAAAQACEKLARARTSCMLVSPDAQS